MSNIVIVVFIRTQPRWRLDWKNVMILIVKIRCTRTIKKNRCTRYGCDHRYHRHYCRSKMRTIGSRDWVPEILQCTSRGNGNPRRLRKAKSRITVVAGYDDRRSKPWLAATRCGSVIAPTECTRLDRARHDRARQEREASWEGK